ncbi:MAG: DUF1684 domain-containing protein [Deltaproteobacteria bacterium]
MTVTGGAARAEWEAWRRERVARLTGERGWLSVVALHWLAPGVNRPEGLPGSFTLGDGRVELDASPGDAYALDGAPVERRVLVSDVSSKPDLLSLGASRHVQLLERGGRHALRVWDADAPARRDFPGIETFPFDPAWIVEARWEPFPGRAAFAVGGRALSLEPTQDGDRLAFVFRDATAGTETYGAGRFLSAGAPREGRVVLDFNRAFNPPCAFTPFATCPLPRPENVLPVPVTAGERFDGGH